MDKSASGVAGSTFMPISGAIISAGSANSSMGCAHEPTVCSVSCVNRPCGRMKLDTMPPSCSQLEAGVRTSSSGSSTAPMYVYVSTCSSVMPPVSAP